MYREDCTYLKKIMSSICFFIVGIIQGAIVLVYICRENDKWALIVEMDRLFCRLSVPFVATFRIVASEIKSISSTIYAYVFHHSLS